MASASLDHLSPLRPRHFDERSPNQMSFQESNGTRITHSSEEEEGETSSRFQKLKELAIIGGSLATSIFLSAGLSAIASKIGRPETLKLLKNSSSIAAIGGFSAALAAASYDINNFRKRGFNEDRTASGLIGRIAIVFAITTLVSPTLSKHLSKRYSFEKVTYSQSATLAGMGILLFNSLSGRNSVSIDIQIVGKNIVDDEKNHRLNQYVQRNFACEEQESPLTRRRSSQHQIPKLDIGEEEEESTPPPAHQNNVSLNGAFDSPLDIPQNFSE